MMAWSPSLLGCTARLCAVSTPGNRRQVVSLACRMAGPLGEAPVTAALVWFRNDLRVADHEALYAAVASQPDALLPLYCLDERELHPRLLAEEPVCSPAPAPATAPATAAAVAAAPAAGGAGQEGTSFAGSSTEARAAGSGLGVPKLGPYRLRALLEALSALNLELRSRGSQLVFHQGTPEVIIGRVADELLSTGQRPTNQVLPEAGGPQDQAQHSAGFGALELHYHLEPSVEAAAVEAAVEAAVQAAAARHGVSCSIHRHWGATLYHPDDLPYHLFDSMSGRGGSGSSAQRGCSSGAVAQEAAGKESQHAQQHGMQAAHGEVAHGHRALVLPRRLESLPGVQTHFRKAVQAHTRVRRPLPKPATLPPLPAAADPRPLLGQPLPSDLVGVYEAAGAGKHLQRLESLAGVQAGALPPPGAGPVHPDSAFPFIVGEGLALSRLKYYLGLEASDGINHRGPQDLRAVDGYQGSRMTPYGVDNSAKLSPFLSLGCLSPRTVYWKACRALELEEGGGVGSAVHSEQQAGGQAGFVEAAGNTVLGQQPPQQQEEEVGEGGHWDGQGRQGGSREGQGEEPVWREPVKGDSVRWLLMHLGIRDFFIYTALKEGAGLLCAGGIAGRRSSWRSDDVAVQRWAQGQTGLPFVDACMRELAATGFMSNRGRQNVASLLAKGLCIDWRLGAALFESLLVDHDFCLNMGNWSYVAGTGNDPRDRQFRTVSQGEAYDPDACLIRTWVPELSHLRPQLAHRPWEAVALAGQEGADADAGRGLARLHPGPEQQGNVAVAETLGMLAAAAAADMLCQSRGRRDKAYPVPLVDPSTQIRKGPWQKPLQKA